MVAGVDYTSSSLWEISGGVNRSFLLFQGHGMYLSERQIVTGLHAAIRTIRGMTCNCLYVGLFDRIVNILRMDPLNICMHLL